MDGKKEGGIRTLTGRDFNTRIETWGRMDRSRGIEGRKKFEGKKVNERRKLIEFISERG
ncbi:hypothetical protein ALC53_12907 [Atta colombica]|uniref:Uncharacterized protein n=1 Tax=Atta colombica TaxID=520822 RepID=A0A151HZ74_9HYME|nr:hypothetical protein ALC53_12907 [Atta colombica]